MSYLQESGGTRGGYLEGQRGENSGSNALGTVDLFSGGVKLPLVFGTMEGRDHLSVTLQANYMQQEPEEFYKQNRKSPGSVLGYGWSMQLPAIIVAGSRVKQSYQRKFCLVGSGGTFPLYRIGKTAGQVEFLSIEHPLWKFYFCDNTELSYWEVHKEDGSVWKYGGTADASEYALCWDNWIGPSASGGATQFTNGWYLSKITGAMGAAVEYQYENVQESLGGSSYTRTMRLSQVISAYGQTARFSYLPKEGSEYGTNHPAKAGQNAWQEKYEDQYLDSIAFSNEKGELLYKQKLTYELKDCLEGEQKRFLVSVAQVTASGDSMPPTTFSYAKEKEAMGLLKEVHYPLAGRIQYTYENNVFPGSEGSGSLALPYDWETHVYTGDDFYLCLYQRDTKIQGLIHDWDMGWQQFALDFLKDVQAEDVNVNIGSGYVCLSYLDLPKNRYVLKVVKRCPVRRFHWEDQEWVMENSKDRPALACGSDFIAFMEKGENSVKILQYKYTDNSWHENMLPADGRDFQALGAGDGFLLGAFGDGQSQSVRFLSFYADEDHNWQVGHALEVSANVDWSLVKNGSVWAVGSCHAGACFVTQEGQELKTTLALLSWTDNYQLNRYEVHDFSYRADIEMPVLYAVATDTMVGYGENIYRYEPEGWVHGKLLTPQSGGQYRYSYGSDTALGVEKIEGEHRFYALVYCPYSRQWEQEGAPFCSNISQYEGVCQPLAVGEYAVLGKNIFTFTKGNWEQIGYLEEGADYEYVQADASGSYLLYQRKAYRQLLQVPLINHALGSQVQVYEGLCLDNSRASGFQSASFGFYGFSVSGQEQRLQLFRVKDHIYREKQDAVMVSEISSDYGAGKDHLFLSYDLENARYEGNSPALAKAEVSLAEADGSFGKIEYRYYNGASSDRFSYPEDAWTNVIDFYSHLKGQVEQTIEYNGDGKKMQSNRNWYRAMDTMGYVICKTRMQQQRFLSCRDAAGDSSAEGDCIQETNIYTEYEDCFYQQRQLIKEAMDGNGEIKRICTELTYAWEKIPQMLEMHRLTDVYLSLQKEEDTGKILSQQRYQYNCTPSGRYYLQKEEVYDDTWEEPWVCQREVTQVNQWGEIVCEKDTEGQPRTCLYDSSQNFLVAEFSNASPEQVLYCGFEEYEKMDGCSMKKGSLKDYIKEGTGFGGNHYLEIERGNSLVLEGKAAKEGILVSFGAKSMGAVFLSLNGKVQELSSKTAGWEKLFGTYIPKSEEEEVTVELYGEEDVMVTGVFLSPLLSKGNAYVYTGNFMQQTAVYSNRGQGSRVWYDRLENEVASYREDGTFAKLVRIRHGQQEGNGGFVPDETASVAMPKGGFIRRRGEENGDPSGLWRQQGMEWTFQASENLVMFFAECQDACGFHVTLGGISLKKENTTWALTNGNEKLAEGNIDIQDYFMLLRVGERLQVSWGGQLWYSGVVNGLSGALEARLSWKGEKEPEILGFAPDPQVTLSFTDYAGKPVQDIGVTEHGIVVGAMVYNALGQGEIVSRNTYIEGACWEYRDRFVEKYDWNTGKLEGEQAELYPEDAGYSYSQVQCTREPQPQPSCVGQAGKKWNIAAGGKVTQYEYFSNAVSMYGIPPKACRIKQQISPDGKRLLEATDGFGNTILSIAGDSTDGCSVTKSEYDGAGNLVRVYYPNFFANQDGGSFCSIYGYDGRNRLIFQKEPDTPEVRFIYDRTGKVRFKHIGGREGEYLYYVYDSYGRKSQEGWAKGTWDEKELKKAANTIGIPPEESVARFRYFYDGDGSDASLLGRLCLAQSFDDAGNLVASETYSYDSMGNVSCRRTCTGEHQEDLMISWDEAGNAASYTLEKDTVTYQYDLMGRLCGIDYQGTCIYTCSYNSEGNVVKEVYAPDSPEKLEREYDYDSAQWLTAIRDNCFSQELTYNEGGKITKSVGGMAGSQEEWKYAYDSSGRLCSYEKSGEKNQIGLDANGNQTLLGEERYTYDSGTNRLLKAGGQQFTYDCTGSVAKIQPSEIILEYDRVTNRIASIRQGEHSSSYDYAVSGIAGIHNGENTAWLVQDAQGRLLCETRQDGSRVWCIYGARGIAAMVLDGDVYYMVKDYHGSICGIYKAGQVLAEFSYDPKGKIISQTIKDDAVNRLVPLRFIGARYEEDYGLYRMKYRLYDPVTGRFMNIDPENQYASPYIYGEADWVNYIDPDGASSIGWSILSILAGVACIIAGAALTIATAGMGSGAGFALGLVGAGILGAGIGVATYGISSAISGDFKFTDCLIYAGMGFLSGAVGAGIGAGVSAIAPAIGATASALVDIGTGIVVGGADAFLSNGFINLNHQESFCKNWGVNVAIGCIVGGIAGCFSGMSSALRNNRAFIGKSDKYMLGIQNYPHAGKHGHLHLRYKRPGMQEMYTDYGYTGVRNFNQKKWNENTHMFQVNKKTMNRYFEDSLNIEAKYGEYSVLGDWGEEFIVNQNIIGPNCTTYVMERLASGGINMPIWMRSPSLAYFWSGIVSAFQ